MECDEFLLEISEWLVQAQQQYKLHYDCHHRELEFELGQWVWLRLLNRPLASLDVQGRGKLGPKFYGPFEVEERVGEVTYKLKLWTVPASTMFFMWGCSWSSLRLSSQPRFHQRTMVESVLSQKKQTSVGWHGAGVNYWSSGRASPRID
jgi:hypothetical protein